MLSTVQELKLIARCIAFDDRDAFGLLVEEYSVPLNRFIFNLTKGDAALTDDISQETFIKAWLSLRQFKGISKFKTWLFKIACNEFATHCRRNKSITESNGNTETVNVAPHDSTDARLDVEWLLSTLNDKERTVILLFYLEELPVKKIVEITGFPEGTVKVYISRAREKMKNNYLNDYYERQR